MAWATGDQTRNWTTADPTGPELERASAVIDIYAGVTEDQPEDSISAVDRRWLAMACAFQVAWQKNRPGYDTERESHTDTSADGVRVGRAADSQIMLAPLAARCLKNLSWLGVRSVNHAGPIRPKGSFLSEEADAAHSWTPLPIA